MRIRENLVVNYNKIKQLSVSVKKLSADSCPVVIWCSWNKHASFKNIKFPQGNYQTSET